MSEEKKRPVRMVEMDTSDEMIDRIFRDGITCEAEVEIGEVVDCLMVMFRNIQGAEMVRDFKKVLGPEHNENVDKFLMLVLVSEVATLVGNFGKRAKEPAAKA